jgi:hypothetical protein
VKTEVLGVDLSSLKNLNKTVDKEFIMADAIGEFSLKHTGTTYAKTGDEISSYVSWEGSATDFGTVFGTLRFPTSMAEGGATSGSCSWVGQSFLEDGTTLLVVGEGDFEQVNGQNQWLVNMHMDNSNGDQMHSKGKIDLQSRTFQGELFEGK